MKSKEDIAKNYLFFRFPTHYAIVILPFFAGTISIFFFQQLNEITLTDQWDVIAAEKLEIIERYLFFSKMTLAVVFAFFVSFRWALMERDGSYGFWLTQLVKRRTFFYRTVISFLFDASLGILLGIGVLYYLGGIVLPSSELLNLAILLLTHLIILVGLSIFIVEIFQDPELSGMIFLVVYGIILFFITNSSSIWHQMLKSDLHFQDDNIFTSLISSLFLGGFLILMSLLVHIKRGIEI
ncbi:MAG: hypothetical protein ACXAB7_12230 [Candidatus Kariarchaeaceae archaeon]|jgi:hypothetical protein